MNNHKRIIIPNVIANTGKNFLYASIRDLFRYYKISVTEAELYFLCGNMHYEYCKNFNEDSGFDMNFENTSELFHFIEESFCCSCIETPIKSEGIVQQIAEELALGNPLILFIDSRVLDYHTKHYQIKSLTNMHSVILYGIDTSRDTAYICDSYIVGNLGEILTYNGEFPLEPLIRASSKYITFHFKGGQLKPQLWQQRFIWNIRHFLYDKETMDSYLGNYALYQYMNALRVEVEEMKEGLAEKLIQFAYSFSLHYLTKYSYLEDIIEEKECCQNKNWQLLLQGVKDVKDRFQDFSIRVFAGAHLMKKEQLLHIINYGIETLRKQEELFEQILYQMEVMIAEESKQI